MTRLICRASLVAIALAGFAAPPADAEERKPETTEKVTETATRLVYANGDVEFEVAGRGKVKFVPPPRQAREEPKPRLADIARGYLTFAIPDREGVLPEYRPAAGELTDEVSMFASPGEFEPATFAIRPLRELGTVRLKANDLRGSGGARIPASSMEVYIVEPTVEQVSYSDSVVGNKVHWVAKWLRPGKTAQTAAGRNTQVYLDVRVPEDAEPGRYSGAVTIRPEKGKASSFTVHLEVLPLKLSRPMPWGLYDYDWETPNERAEWLLWKLKEMRRAGLTQCVISPEHSQKRPGIQRDGSVDCARYDRFIELYQQAGLTDPPILSMEGIRLSAYEFAQASLDKRELGFYVLHPTSKELAAAYPSFLGNMREWFAKVIRGVYDHSLEAKWPPYYIYFVDEPGPGTESRIEELKFVCGMAREVAPEMQLACTFGAHDPSDWSKYLPDELLDLQICNLRAYVNPCVSADANRRWHELASRQHMKLYGYGFPVQRDRLWANRSITFLAEKANLEGLMPWAQWIGSEEKVYTEPFTPYRSLLHGKGGPYFRRYQDGSVWRTTTWLGVREGIDDSRYVQTLRKLLVDAEVAGREAVAKKAREHLQEVLDRVPWLSESRPWNAVRADAARRELAEAAIECLQALQE